MSNQPTRTCISCRLKNDKCNLLRLVHQDKSVVLDRLAKLDGRGAYVCNNEQCVQNLLKKKALSRAFKTNFDISIYAQLQEDFNNGSVK